MIDTAILRERGPYITSMASDGYPVICVDIDSWIALCDEVDRLCRREVAYEKKIENIKAAYIPIKKMGQNFALGLDEIACLRNRLASSWRMRRVVAALDDILKRATSDD